MNEFLETTANRPILEPVSTVRPPAAISLPTGFIFGEVPPVSKLPQGPTPTAPPPPPLGALTGFAGNWTGTGFNTIFRPESSQTPTPFPKPPTQQQAPFDDNVLELNLTTESLSFSASLGSVPNRGMVQADLFLNGVPYLQTISDVTTPGKSVGIHVEPGIWTCVPATNDPAEGQTIVRMGSIPHGATILAQGTSTTASGAPNIPRVDITPTLNGSPIAFPSQKVANELTLRIPQDLSAFVAAGTITQAMLDDPNTVLRAHIQGLTIVETTTITISTASSATSKPNCGGGTDNMAFLVGTPASKPNANTTQMTATFWIETVEHTLHIPIFKPGQAPLMLKPETAVPGQPVPTFSVSPPMEISAPRTLVFRSTQIQYTQNVILNFNGLNWPHVSVATLQPASAQVVPPSAWA